MTRFGYTLRWRWPGPCVERFLLRRAADLN